MLVSAFLLCLLSVLFGSGRESGQGDVMFSPQSKLNPHPSCQPLLPPQTGFRFGGVCCTSGMMAGHANKRDFFSSGQKLETLRSFISVEPYEEGFIFYLFIFLICLFCQFWYTFYSNYGLVHSGQGCLFAKANIADTVPQTGWLT